MQGGQVFTTLVVLWRISDVDTYTDQSGSVSGVSSVNNFSAQINAQIKTVSQFNSNLKHKSHRSRSIRFHENHGMVR